MRSAAMSGDLDLVTGGNGFIGRHLVHGLKARGRRVRVLDLGPADPHVGADEHLQGDITDPDLVDRAVTGADCVFHVAGNPQLWSTDGFDTVNRTGAAGVLFAAHRAGVRRIILTSTHALDVRVSGSPQMSDMPGPYTRAKLAAELAAQKLIGQGAPITIVAPTMPLGPGDMNLTPPTRMILEFLRGDNPAFLEFEANLIDVREVAEGHIMAGANGQVGARYVLGRHNVKLSDLLPMLRRLSGVKMPGRQIPYGLAWLSAAAMQGVARVSGGTPRASIEGVRLARRLSAVPENPAAALDLPAWPLETMLSDTLDDLGKRKLWSPHD